MNKLLRSLAVLALGFSVVAFGGSAEAKGKGKGGKAPTASVDAKFGRWLITPHGKIDGMLLDSGSIVVLHPDAVRDSSLKTGDAIHLDAKAKGSGAAIVYVRAKVTKGSVVVVDDTAKHGKGGKGPKGGNAGTLSDLTVASKVSSFFVGPKGKVRGVIMDDGTIAYAPHHQDLGTYSLKKGDAISVTGKGGNYTLGRALVIKTLKLPNGDVKTL